MDLLSKAVDMLKTTTLTENGHEAYHDYYFSSFLDQCVIFNTKAIGNRPGSKNSSGGISRTDFESHLDKLYTMLGNCNVSTPLTYPEFDVPSVKIGGDAVKVEPTEEGKKE